MTRAAYVLWLFLKRGFLTTISYRTALVLSLFGGFISLLQFYFMGRFLAEGNTFPAIREYGDNLLAYLIIGTAFTSFLGVSLSSFQTTIRSEQQMGTLQHLLLGRVRIEGLLVCSSVWTFLWTTVNAALLLFAVAAMFGVHMNANPLPAAIVMMLTVIALSGLGLMSAGIIIVIKQGDPITWLFSIATGLLSGVLFPIQFLPGPLRAVSYLLPTTHALHALRLSLMRNATLVDVGGSVAALAGFAVVLFPLGLVVFRKGYDRARAHGSLAEY
jgi:ABC-2 type transport system permease protein